jgi:nucleoside-diphosphate-sugar epimerase
VTSGTAIITPAGQAVTEEDDPPPRANSHPRVASEEAAGALAKLGVRVSVLRLPPSVHGEGDHGFVPAIIGISRAKGAAYVGDGRNRWPAVHRIDAARLYRLALEKGAVGARYHGVADEGVPFRDIAAVIGRRLNIPVQSKSVEEAAEHFGFLGRFVSMDLPASSTLTQKWLGWHPSQPGLIADLDQPYYFKA